MSLSERWRRWRGHPYRAHPLDPGQHLTVTVVQADGSSKTIHGTVNSITSPGPTPMDSPPSHIVLRENDTREKRRP